MYKKLYIVLILSLLSNVLIAQIKLKLCPVFNDSIVFKQHSTSDSISVLKFYISNIQVLYRDGATFKEENSYYLLDLENPASFVLALKAPSKSIYKISFNIGVDSATSVSGALDGDLDPTKGMYWAWQSGYVNFKLEGKSTTCKNSSKEFQFHIGGYRSPYYALRRIDIPILNQMNSNIDIEMNIDLLLAKIDLGQINSIMIPCKEAMQVADYLPLLFSNK